MREDGVKNKTVKVAVRFTQQQIELFDKLKQEGKFGGNYPDIVVNLFHEYMRETFGKGGA